MRSGTALRPSDTWQVANAGTAVKHRFDQAGV